MTITVVIPAHNEADFITGILETVRNQSRLPDEVAVVCDRCTDDTQTRAETAFVAFPPQVHCQIVIADAGDIGGARNAGIRATTGDILVCVDCDTLLHPDVLRAVEKSASDGVILGGFKLALDARYQRSWGQTILYKAWMFGIDFCAFTLRNFVGTGCFFRRDLNLLYDETWGWGEDIEFCGRVKRLHRGKTAYLQNATLVYCDRRFIERGYRKELLRRLTRGIDHLRRERVSRQKRFV